MTEATVTQADRDAAADLAIEMQMEATAYVVRKGKHGADMSPLTQAFARHREAHSTAASQASDAGEDYLEKRKQINLILANLIAPHMPDVAERIEVGNRVCTEILATLTAPPTSDAGGNADQSDEYLIRKNGYYYRPNANGYTLCVADAGRFSLAEAIKHSHPNGPDGPRDGITYEAAPPIALSPPTSGEELRLREAAEAALKCLEISVQSFPEVERKLRAALTKGAE